MAGSAEPRNIVICSDGTGNRGGHGAPTNVFKIYKALRREGARSEQFAAYDDGVGTSEYKPLWYLGNIFGVGFERNVRQLYSFIARQYRPGDRIFMFGFSRGAATVRAVAGLILACGLVDTRPGNQTLSDEDLELLVDEAMKAYREAGRGRKQRAREFRETYCVKSDNSDDPIEDGVPVIEFVGVWDTVSALGFPQDLSFAIRLISTVLEPIANWLMPHKFYDYQLNDRVKVARQALAIDDQRKTFHPKVWTEKPIPGDQARIGFLTRIVRNVRERGWLQMFDRRPSAQSSAPGDIEQVWFCGMHSDVGGGYPRNELSSVTLLWMMRHAEHCGLEFSDRAVEEAENNAKPLGKIHDSRSGVWTYYRYVPRDIKHLTEGRLADNEIKIHSSVAQRINRQIDDYLPLNLIGLENIKIVDTPKSPGKSKAPSCVKSRESSESITVKK